MGEIKEFYSEFERELNNIPGVVSKRIKETDRIGHKAEKRVYEVFVNKNIIKVKEKIEDRIPVKKVKIEDDKLLVTTNYDKESGSPIF